MKVLSRLFILALAIMATGCCGREEGVEFAKDLPVDERPAMQEIFDKASSGDTNAQAYLGVLFYTGTIGRNHNAAFNWFKKASENGSGEADYFLSEMYEQGVHVGQDAEMAFKYLKSSALKGFTSARIKLADLYLKGERASDLNKEELLQWLGTYAAEGNTKAKELLVKFQKPEVTAKKEEAPAKAEPKADGAKKASSKKGSSKKTAKK